MGAISNGFLNWRKNAGEGLGELAKMAKNYPASFASKTPAQKARSIMLGAGAVSACAVSAFLPALTDAFPAFAHALAHVTSLLPASPALVSGGGLFAAQMLGFAAYGVSLVLPNLEKNKNVIALQPAVGYTIAAQKLALGGLGYAVMAGIAATRAMTLSFIPEDRTRLRRGIALGYWGAGVATIGTIAAFTSPWNAAPIVSMTLGTFADTVKSENTRYARLMRLAANVNNAVYSLVFSGSISGSIMDVTSTVNLSKNINKFDVPKSDAEARVSLAQRLRLYAQNMLTFKPMPDIYPVPKAELPVRQDPVFKPVPTPVQTQDAKFGGLDSAPALSGQIFLAAAGYVEHDASEQPASAPTPERREPRLPS